MKSTIWLIIFAIVLGIVLVGFFSGRFSSGVPVEAAAVRRGAIREFIDEQAKTRLPETYLITMPFQGRIEAITITEGMSVKKDQVVAQIVPRDLDLAVAEATAAVAAPGGEHQGKCRRERGRKRLSSGPAICAFHGGHRAGGVRTDEVRQGQVRLFHEGFIPHPATRHHWSANPGRPGTVRAEKGAKRGGLSAGSVGPCRHGGHGRRHRLDAHHGAAIHRPQKAQRRRAGKAKGRGRSAVCSRSCKKNSAAPCAARSTAWC